MALQQQLRKVKEQLDAQRDEVKRLTDENISMKRAADKLHVSMSRKDDLFAEQLPDDRILGSIVTLFGQIKGWSTHFLKAGDVGQAMLKEEDLVHYRSVFPRVRSLESLQEQFHDRKRRRLFVRAWTAYVICDAVFSASRQKAHAGDVEVTDASTVERILALEGMMRSMRIPPEKLNDWRAFSFQLLTKPENGSGTKETVPQWLVAECTRKSRNNCLPSFSML
ncbi:hypothetical protein SLS54_010380 [Diplodia seriata]